MLGKAFCLPNIRTLVFGQRYKLRVNTFFNIEIIYFILARGNNGPRSDNISDLYSWLNMLTHWYSEHDISRQLTVMSDWLSYHPGLLDGIDADLRRLPSAPTGRKVLTTDPVLRAPFSNSIGSSTTLNWGFSCWTRCPARALPVSRRHGCRKNNLTQSDRYHLRCDQGTDQPTLTTSAPARWNSGKRTCCEFIALSSTHRIYTQSDNIWAAK